MRGRKKKFEIFLLLLYMCMKPELAIVSVCVLVVIYECEHLPFYI